VYHELENSELIFMHHPYGVVMQDKIIVKCGIWIVHINKL